MTAQLTDSVLYQGRGFALLRSHGTGLFEPSAHGLSPRPISTACHRGWFCTYAVVARVPFSGTWVLGRDAVRVESPAHALLPEWRFREVLQLLFDEGRLVEVSEDTQETERLRAK